MLKKHLTALAQSPLVRSASIYTVTSALSAAIPFLMMPVLTRYLSPADYGISAMLGVMVGVASPFIGLSIHGAVSVRYFDRNADIPRYIGNGYLIIGASSALAGLLLWAFAGPISSVTAFPRNWLWTVVILAGCQSITLIMLTVWQVQDRPLQYGTFQTLQVILNIVLTLVIVIFINRSWEGLDDGLLAV